MIIGIDGPAGTGKTTIAKLFEEKYNIRWKRHNRGDTPSRYRSYSIRYI